MAKSYKSSSAELKSHYPIIRREKKGKIRSFATDSEGVFRLCRNMWQLSQGLAAKNMIFLGNG